MVSNFTLILINKKLIEEKDNIVYNYFPTIPRTNTFKKKRQIQLTFCSIMSSGDGNIVDKEVPQWINEEFLLGILQKNHSNKVKVRIRKQFESIS